MLRLTFLGAMNCIGSSGVLVENGKERLVLDYGTNVQETLPTFPIKVEGKLDGIFLSHAHLDHSGGLPILMHQSSCPIYASTPSRSMVDMLLDDTLKIARYEGTHLPFTMDHKQKVIKRFKYLEYRKPATIGSVKATVYDAGHVPGSMMTFIQTDWRRGKDSVRDSARRSDKGNGRGCNSILYTGDFNTVDTRLVAGADTRLPEVDVLVTESTYADREHPDREGQEKELVSTVQDTLANDGITLVSNFAISRTQEVLLVLDEYGIDYPLYMDGMAKKATTIINNHPVSTRDPTALDRALRKVHYLTNERQRARAIKNPCVILTTSGMLQGGPVIWYMQRLYDRAESSLILTGYQVRGTAGHNLLETGRLNFEDHDRDHGHSHGQSHGHSHGRNQDRNQGHKTHVLKVKMGVRRLDFSSHIGRKDLFAFVERLGPKKVFCVHGDDTLRFAEELREKGFDAIAPLPDNRVFTLD